MLLINIPAIFVILMNQSAEDYFVTGCMRCALGNTPQCKVHDWEKPLRMLRAIVLECGLTETAKWGVPCYTYLKKNLILISAFKSFCIISFFNGSLLQDKEGLLSKPGPNSQTDRWIKFTSYKQVTEIRQSIQAYIYEAMEAERLGLKPAKESKDLMIPTELQVIFNKERLFQKAFKALTPGRQRGYLIFFSQPKQSQTRVSRIEKCKQQIFEGRGMHD